MVRKRTVAAAAVLCLLAACAATGVRVTDEQVSALKVGETTEAQAVQALGAPTMRMRLGDGTTMLMYSYAEISVRPATFIPIVGPLVGGSDMRTNSVTLSFDSAGKLKTSTSTTSATGTSTGLAAGVAPTQPTQQPRQ